MPAVFARPTALLRILPVVLLAFGLASCQPPPKPKAAPEATAPKPVEEKIFPVMLGIDVWESQHFAEAKGKRVGLLTHAAGVNRQGVSTIEVLRRSPEVKLVALYGVEHGLYGKIPASQNYQDGIDPATKLPVYSLYNGKSRKPTPTQLEGIDVLVIDLQDIGTRSYTFISAMRLALEACFENKKEVIVLDRPNPLGGIKVDGPPLDAEWAKNNYVGAFRVPYVHGLTMGELANLAKRLPGVLAVADSVREAGKLTIIPMKGWKREMRWPDTGLTWVPTSPKIQDFAAAVGYPITGLGCEIGGFYHGIGNEHPFRGIGFRKMPPEQVKAALDALHLPGMSFDIITVTGPDGKPLRGVFAVVTDWNLCRPTELSFHLMKLAAAWNPKNPFAAATPEKANSFNKHCGSTAWWNALVHDGAKVDVQKFLTEWRARAEGYQTVSRKYWLYPG